MSNIYTNLLKLGSLSFLGVVISVGIFTLKANTLCNPKGLITASQSLIADLPNTLPPPNLPINPGGTVKVPPLNRPESSRIPTIPSQPVLPTNQTADPAVQRLPNTISQPPNSPPVIEFGQPLPKVK